MDAVDAAWACEKEYTRRRYEQPLRDAPKEAPAWPSVGAAGEEQGDGIALYLLEADVGGCEQANTAQNYKMLHTGDRLQFELKENGFIAVSFQKDDFRYHLGFLNQAYAINYGLSILLAYPEAFGVAGSVRATVTEVYLEDPKWPRAFFEVRCLTDMQARRTKKGFLVTPDETIAVKLLKEHEKIAFPSGIKEIAPCALLNASRVRFVKLPAGLEKIGYNAFTGSNIGKVAIPASVTDIGDGAFKFCPKDYCPHVETEDWRKGLSFVYFDMEKGNAHYRSNGGQLIDMQRPENDEAPLMWNPPIDDYTRISMPWASSKYMTEDDTPALAELKVQRTARREAMLANPTPTLLASICIYELRTQDSSPSFEAALAKIDKLSPSKRNELLFTIAGYGNEEQCDMLLANASRFAENLSFLFAEAISLNNFSRTRKFAQAGAQLHSKQMRIPDKTHVRKTILCSPVELALQNTPCETPVAYTRKALLPRVNNSGCIAKLAEEGFLTRENIREFFQSAWQGTTPFAQEKLRVLVRFVHPDDVEDKMGLCENLIAHGAGNELEYAFSWPDFPSIDQLEELVQFANERNDAETTVLTLETYRRQQPPDPTESLLL